MSHIRSNTSSSKSSLKYSKRLIAVGVLASAALPFTTAGAAVVVVQPNLFQSSGSGFFSFNPTASDFVATYDESYDCGMRNCGLNLLSFNTTDFNWASSILDEGSIVDNSQAFSSDSSRFLTIPTDGNVVSVGYRLANQGSANDENYFGFVQVTGNGSNNFTIDTYSYQTSPNTGILINAVPEPSSVLLSLVGMSSLILRRRRIA
jgi:hypothetical protein